MITQRLFLIKRQLDLLFLLLGFPSCWRFLLLFFSIWIVWSLVFLSNNFCLLSLLGTSNLRQFLLRSGCVFPSVRIILLIRPMRRLLLVACLLRQILVVLGVAFPNQSFIILLGNYFVAFFINVGRFVVIVVILWFPGPGNWSLQATSGVSILAFESLYEGGFIRI